VTILGVYRYDPMKFDVWSCGVILFFMVCGDVVFKKLGGQVLDPDYPPIWSCCTSPVVN
jgi:hypothetical protein